MSGRRKGSTGQGIALFPFLAVLICTMGALIVLLVLVVQQARVQAGVVSKEREEAIAQQQAQTEAARLEQEDYEWRSEVLEQQRAELIEQRDRQRLELAHAEDHIRRLMDQWSLLKKQAAALQQAGAQTEQERHELQMQLDQLQQQIEQQQSQLERARREAAARHASYTIIPYGGRQGTHRRPIYIECTADAITLQPENIVLGPADFDGPLGPGNPLDAALRAVRQYWAALGQNQWQGEPYPLLVVRPDGAISYAVARAAMKHWEDEFGYELVDAEMELQFPPADPQLADLVRRAIDDARQREAMLAAAMPSRYRTGARRRSRATGRGFEAFSEASDSPKISWHQGTSGSRPADRSLGTEENKKHHSEQGPQTTAAENSAQQSAVDGPGGSEKLLQGSGVVGALAQARGADWALPKSSARPTAIARPIHVACYADRLVILPDKGNPQQPKTIMIQENLSHTIDGFVSMIWTHMEDWGIAVAGGYWRPILQVEVTPDGEQRYYELQRLMEGSGIVVERKRS